jgi:hypothetical protein
MEKAGDCGWTPISIHDHSPIIFFIQTPEKYESEMKLLLSYDISSAILYPTQIPVF